jgi:REP element-mobilizing transposase RayT
MDRFGSANFAHAPIRSRGRLPHLYRDGGTYFVTFRLFDAVVHAPDRAKDTSIDNADLADDPSALLSDYDPPLRLGSCLLERPAVAEIVQNAIMFFDGTRYEMIAWCVMPNHVHVVFAPLNGYGPDQILHSWKSFTAHAVNKLLNRTGPPWERESFDHLVRNMASLDRFVRYTEDNPVAAGLCVHPWEWTYSSAQRVHR